MKIALSILEFEPDLSVHIDDISESDALPKIFNLIGTGRIHRVHIDVMRPPMIPGKAKFSVDLICRLYEVLHGKISLAAHLMVQEPFPIIDGMNEFIARADRAGMTLIIQRESFGSEDETIGALDLLKGQGYKAGICIDLPTPSKVLTKKIVESADAVLLMSVPMGKGGQEYGRDATERIACFSREHPDRTMEVDGGIDPRTIARAERAGAGIVVVGSFITRSKNPEGAVLELEAALRHKPQDG